MRVWRIERALHGLKSLQEMIKRVFRAINYDSMLSNEIQLERAWQMEFYKASYRCTSSDFMTSADVGALFGSKGFIDFTIHCEDDFWGFELLREANRLDEHIHRFAPDGRYSLLQLSDNYIACSTFDASRHDTTRTTIATELNRCEGIAFSDTTIVKQMRVIHYEIYQ